MSLWGVDNNEIPPNGRCTAETTTSCDKYPFYDCRDISTETNEGTCQHKKPFPVEGKEWGGLVLFAIVMALCNIAGIGGGGIANPVL